MRTRIKPADEAAYDDGAARHAAHAAFARTAACDRDDPRIPMLIVVRVIPGLPRATCAGQVPDRALNTHRLALRDVERDFPRLLDPSAGVVKALVEC